MSQYTFSTTVCGLPTVVLTGFCARSASFFGMLFEGSLETDPVKKSKPLSNAAALFTQLDAWGVAVPQALEEAIDGDIADWNHGSGDLRLFGRKAEHFGYIPPVKPKRIGVHAKLSKR